MYEKFYLVKKILSLNNPLIRSRVIKCVQISQCIYFKRKKKPVVGWYISLTVLFLGDVKMNKTIIKIASLVYQIVQQSSTYNIPRLDKTLKMKQHSDRGKDKRMPFSLITIKGKNSHLWTHKHMTIRARKQFNNRLETVKAANLDKSLSGMLVCFL